MEYIDAIGIQELLEFFKVATPAQKRLLLRFIRHSDYEKINRLVEFVTKMPTDFH